MLIGNVWIKSGVYLFTRDSIYAVACICYRPSVRPSVRWVDHTKTVDVRKDNEIFTTR